MATAFKIAMQKKEIGDFVEKCDKFFNVMNSQQQFDCDNFCCGFGVHFEEQYHVLEDFKNTVKNMKVLHVRTQLPQNSWLPFQRGIIISLINLFHDIKERYPIVDYIVTARLNQDPLENLFSCVRGLGGSFTQPGPVEFMN